MYWKPMHFVLPGGKTLCGAEHGRKGRRNLVLKSSNEKIITCHGCLQILEKTSVKSVQTGAK